MVVSLFFFEMIGTVLVDEGQFGRHGFDVHLGVMKEHITGTDARAQSHTEMRVGLEGLIQHEIKVEMPAETAGFTLSGAPCQLSIPYWIMKWSADLLLISILLQSFLVFVSVCAIDKMLRETPSSNSSVFFI